MELNDKCWLKKFCNHKDCNSFCMRFYKLNYLYNEALISEAQREHINLRLDKDEKDRQAFERLSEICNDIENFFDNGCNLYIHSTIAGNGKTSWSLRLIESYFNKIWYKSDLSCKALFINVPRFLIALKENITQQSSYIDHIKENIASCDVVIWDDIGTKQSTAFENENLLSMIDLRIANGKSNIYTSNLNDIELHQALGDRLHSRVVNYSEEIVLYGADKRSL